jgi:HEAT repeat protein
MIKLLSILAMAPIAALLAAAPASESQTLNERAWLILQQGLTSKRAAKRADAAHALRLLVNNPRAEEMAQGALADPNPKVRAAAARALGPMEALSSVPALKELLNDRAPIVVLAAARSLFQLGERQAVYDLDAQMLNGERKSSDGFVTSQINELRDPKAAATMGLEAGIGFAPFGGEAYEALKRIRKDDRTPVRAAAVKELGRDRDLKTGAALARACSDRKWPVRAAAVYAIARRGDAALLNAITPSLDDKNQIVRYEAAAAVLRLTGNEEIKER